MPSFPVPALNISAQAVPISRSVSSSVSKRALSAAAAKRNSWSPSLAGSHRRIAQAHERRTTGTRDAHARATGTRNALACATTATAKISERQEPGISKANYRKMTEPHKSEILPHRQKSVPGELLSIRLHQPLAGESKAAGGGIAMGDGPPAPLTTRESGMNAAAEGDVRCRRTNTNTARIFALISHASGVFLVTKQCLFAQYSRLGVGACVCPPRRRASACRSSRSLRGATSTSSRSAWRSRICKRTLPTACG